MILYSLERHKFDAKIIFRGLLKGETQCEIINVYVIVLKFVLLC